MKQPIMDSGIQLQVVHARKETRRLGASGEGKQ